MGVDFAICGSIFRLQRRVVSLKFLRLTRGRKARRSLLRACRPRVKQDEHPVL
jgi:hypothetical protein